jgi:hypothetical protein
LRDTVFHALDAGNLVRALQEERAAVLLNTFLLEPDNTETNKTKNTMKIPTITNENLMEKKMFNISNNLRENCDLKGLSKTLSLEKRY